MAEYRMPLNTVFPIMTVTILHDLTRSWAENGMFFRAMIPRVGPIEFVTEGFRYVHTEPVLPASPRAPGSSSSTSPAAKKHPKLWSPWRDFRCGKFAPSGA